MSDLIDMNKIFQIESSMNPKAFNAKTQARGLGQITPIVVKEWNGYNPRQKFVDEDMFNPEINKRVATWYMTQRIPQMLKYYKIPVTVENVLSAYNAGIGNVKKGVIPTETQNYIKKYMTPAQ